MVGSLLRSEEIVDTSKKQIAYDTRTQTLLNTFRLLHCDYRRQKPVYCSCAVTIQRPNYPTKVLVAHRGASAYAPEHTLESYQLALKQDADFVEQDLQITRDGVLVCLHDLTLERTTNVKEVFSKSFREELVNGVPVRRWYVSDFTLSQIKQLDAGSWFNQKFKGARVPTFQEAIDLCEARLEFIRKQKLPKFITNAVLIWSAYCSMCSKEIVWINGTCRNTRQLSFNPSAREFEKIVRTY